MYSSLKRSSPSSGFGIAALSGVESGVFNGAKVFLITSSLPYFFLIPFNKAWYAFLSPEALVTFISSVSCLAVELGSIVDVKVNGRRCTLSASSPVLPVVTDLNNLLAASKAAAGFNPLKSSKLG